MPTATTIDGDVLVVCGVSGIVTYVHSFKLRNGIIKRETRAIIIIITDYIDKSI